MLWEGRQKVEPELVVGLSAVRKDVLHQEDQPLHLGLRMQFLRKFADQGLRCGLTRLDSATRKRPNRLATATMKKNEFVAEEDSRSANND